MGDSVRLRTSGGERELRVGGIYQDITNGGKTAKAIFADDADALWQVVMVDLADGVDANAFAEQYRARFPGAKINDIAAVTSQTMAATTSQLRVVARVALVASAGLAFPVTSLFTALVLVRERDEVATQRAVGATVGGLKGQYLIRFTLVAATGVAVGLALVHTLGQAGMRVALGMVGAPGVRLILDPLAALLITPALLTAVVVVASLFTLGRIRTVTLTDSE